MKWGPPSTPAVCTGFYGNSFMLRALDIHMPVIVRRCKSYATYYFRFENSETKHRDTLGWVSCFRNGSWAIRIHPEPRWNEEACRVPESQSILPPPLAVRAHGRFGQLLWSTQPDSCNSGCCWAQLWWSHPCTLGTSSVTLTSISLFRVQAQPGFPEALVQVHFPWSHSGFLCGTL